MSAIVARGALRPGLAQVGLSFSQWLVLSVTAQLVESSGDAVNQAAVARLAGLDRTSTSQAMSHLAENGFVDRGPDMERNEYRIYVSDTGFAALQAAAKHVEAVSRALAEHEG